MKTQNVVLIGCAGIVGLGFLGVLMAAFLSPFLFDSENFALGDGVGVVNLVGTIDDSRDLVEELERQMDDPAVRAVVLRIDSPGGGVAPSQEIHDAVLRLREKKPVVTSIGNVAASGGYYVAIASDSILANPGSLTGSIGVIFEYMTAEQLMQKLGVRLEVYKSGPTKDIGSFHRDPTPAERALLEGMVNDVYNQFVDAVAEGRRLPREKVLALADGSVFTGRQALAAGLVDALGGFHESVLMAARLGGIDGKPRLVSKERRRFRLSDILSEAAEDLVPRAVGPRLEYRLP
jgi:protease-4